MHRPAGRVGILARKSRIVQEGIEADSIEAQVARGYEWAAQNGGSVDPEHVYRENVSAYKASVTRDVMEKALNAMARGELDTLWCYALDRLTRQGAIAMASILQRGGRLYFHWDRLDSADPRDLRMILWRAEDAREYSERLAANVRSTKSHQRDQGAITAKPAYGWRIAAPARARRVERDPDRWPIVERIYRERAEGRSLRGIAAGLNADGIPAPRGGDWAPAVLRRILMNPVYEGWQVISDERHNPVAYRDARGERVSVLAPGVEPLDPDLVRRARSVATRRAFSERSGTASGLLTGILRCEGCGGPMNLAGRREVQYYRCGRFSSGQRCPAPATIIARQIEPYMVHTFREAITGLDPEEPDDLAAIAVVAERWTASMRPRETAEAQEVAQAVRDVERQLDRLMADREAGLYDGPLGARFQRRYAELQAAYEIATARRAQVAAPTLDITWMLDRETLAGAWDAADPETRHWILAAAIRRATVRRAPRGHRQPPSARTRIVFVWQAEDDAE